VERWREQRQRETEAAFFDRLLEKYDVVLDDSLKALIGPLTIRPVAATSR
jgi:hypothetical protein